MAELLKLPRLPDYDPQRDGNRFAWIIREAPRVRAARQAAEANARIRQRIARTLAYPHDKHL